MREYCRLMSSQHLWEICILLETVPPSVLCLCLARLAPNPCSWVWVVVVCHANITLWGWLMYFLTYHSCPSSRQDAQLVNTGTALMVTSSIICVIAALTNDRHFPEARMTLKEAKAFFEHLKTSRPKHTVVIRQKRIGVEFPVDNWYDFSSFPDLTDVSSVEGDVEVKIRLYTEASDHRTEHALNSFIDRTLRDNQEEGPYNYRLITSIPGRKVRVGPRHWNIFPAIKSERKQRIFVYSHNKRFMMMDFFLRTAWIMNILACSGPVLAVFMSLRKRSLDCRLVKKFRVNPDPRSPGYINPAMEDDFGGEPGLVWQRMRDENQQRLLERELPPSYTILHMLNTSPPTYQDAVALEVGEVAAATTTEKDDGVISEVVVEATTANPRLTSPERDGPPLLAPTTAPLAVVDGADAELIQLEPPSCVVDMQEEPASGGTPLEPETINRSDLETELMTTQC